MAVKMKASTITPEIGLEEREREGLARILNTFLADQHTLYTKTRNYHWNVTGIHFIELHELFEEQYDAIKLAADKVAERVRMLGYPAIGTMQEFMEHTRLSEAPGEVPEARDMIEQLTKDHETMIRHLRTDIDRCEDDFNDQGTADLLTAILQEHLEMAWMLRSHLATA